MQGVIQRPDAIGPWHEPKKTRTVNSA
jgi:hypothetical protein